MELIHESLTHLLERSQQPLPFHLQVNLCHDIALALDYLHSNDIIHRDLSSNNVLLDACSRAKVTDFGMSKILGASARTTPFTQCPGTAVYMPPEGQRNPPVYTTKLDCFSFGVLGVQIMTRQFPNPGPEEQVIEDARSPVGTIKVPIPDSERRKPHIDLITPSHPLLPLALHCLRYHDSDRPSAQELCDQLEVLKRGPQYRQSKMRTEDQDQGQVAGQIACQVPESQEKQFQDLNQLLPGDEAVVAGLQQTLAQRERKIDELDETVTTKERDNVPGRRPEQHQLSSPTPADTIKLKWRTCPRAPAGIMKGSAAVNGSRAYFAYRKNVYEYDAEGKQWSPLPHRPNNYTSLVVVNGVLTAVGGEDNTLKPTNVLLSLIGSGRQQKWTEHYPPMPTKRWGPAVACSGNSLVAAGGYSGGYTLVAVEVMYTSTRQWFIASSLPHYYNFASATVCTDTLYLMGGFEKAGKEGSLSVLTCSLTALLDSCTQSKLPPATVPTKEPPTIWTKAADVPVYFTMCTTLCGQVLAIGGNRKPSWEDPDPTDNVYKYDPTKNTWTVTSHLPTPRYRCLVAVLPGNEVVVVGGNTAVSGEMDKVEVGSFP